MAGMSRQRVKSVRKWKKRATPLPSFPESDGAYTVPTHKTNTWFDSWGQYTRTGASNLFPEQNKNPQFPIKIIQEHLKNMQEHISRIKP